MIIRKQCHKDKFTILSNEVLQNPALSWAARGLLGYLLSMPPDWKISIPSLIKQGNLGRDGIRSVLSDLQFAGYLRRVEYRTKEGKFLRYDYEVYDIPGYWKGVSGEQPLTSDGKHRLNPLKLVVVDKQTGNSVNSENESLGAEKPCTASTYTGFPYTAKKGTTKDYIRTKNYDTSSSSSSEFKNSKKQAATKQQQQQNTAEVATTTSKAKSPSPAGQQSRQAEAAPTSTPATHHETEVDPENVVVVVDGDHFLKSFKNKDKEKEKECACAQSGKGKAGKATLLDSSFDPDQAVVDALYNMGLSFRFMEAILTEVIFYWTMGEGKGVPRNNWNQVFYDRCIARWEKLDSVGRLGYADECDDNEEATENVEPEDVKQRRKAQQEQRERFNRHCEELRREREQQQQEYA